MKNQIIKKIMAYLLVGAMVITTPMTASANELENAYATGTDLDKDNDSGSNTNTNSNTKTQPVDVPEVVEKYDLNITGIMLDKDSISFDGFDADGKVKDTLQARVLFDDYDPANEEMAWASLGYDKKKEIEANIHWYSNDNKVVKAVWAKDDPTKATIKAVGAGQAEVTVWIEADGKQYVNNLDRPTEGDYQATAVITVTEKITGITFEQTPGKFFEKRTYDLKESTWLVTSAGEKIRATDPKAEKLVYSLDTAVPKGSTMTLSEDGILTVKKAGAGTNGVKINVVATKSKDPSDAKKFVMTSSPVVFGDAIHATSVTLKKNGEVIKSDILDLGDVNNTSVIVTATLENKKGKNILNTVSADDGSNREDGSTITDVVTWTSKNSNIAEVKTVAGKDDLTREIVAKGVGSTTITATASSGKKANLKVTVDATPSGVKIVDINEKTSGTTYTGKQTTLTAVLTAKDKDGKEFELPVGKTKLTWSTTNKKVAAISGKKEVGTVKPVNGLKNKENKAGDTANVTIEVKATGKNSNKKQYSFEGGYTLTVEQSNVSNISIHKQQVVKEENTDVLKYVQIVSESDKKGTDKAFIGTYNEYKTSVSEADSKYADSIGWTISGAAATLDANGKLTPVKAGKSTVSANYITLDTNGKAKLNKKTVAVTVVQNATSIAFAKPQTVKNVSAKEKPQNVTLKVNTIAPKKATCNVVNWKTLAYIADGDGQKVAKEYPDESVTVAKNAKGANLITKCSKNSVTIAVPGEAKAGSVIKVGAYTDGGVVAYAYIYVTDKTAKLTADKEMSVELGKTKPIENVKIERGKDDTTEANIKNEKFGEKGTKGDTTAYITEPVTYSVDKTSAKYISVDQDGNVTGLQKTGNKKATVTIKTISGKKATVKITVS